MVVFEQAEKERNDTSKRVAEGIRERKAKGLPVGRQKGATYETKKSIAAKAEIRRLSKDFEGTNTDAECIKLCGISRNSYYKYKREMLSE